MSSHIDWIGRRTFLQRPGISLGAMALGSLLGRRTWADQADALDASKGTIQPLHHAPKAKRVIWLYMAGGMTHLETFDHKPKLAEMHGKPMPESITKGQQIAQLQGQKLNCFAPQHSFKPWGKSGQVISEIWPQLASKCADDMCIVRSLHTDAINHDPAHTFMNTGSMISGRPAMGSWLLYGLGAETENMPGFVVMVSTGKYGQRQPIAARQWHSGFLPGQYQGVEFRGTGDPVLYVGNPKGVDVQKQRQVVDAIASLNGLADQRLEDPEIATRVRQYELAFRMQASVPELMDVSKEPEHIFDLYGTKGGDGSFASNCLLARRLAERGVRFIQLYHRDWDHHGAVKAHSEGTAKEVDQGVAALITDLKQRGMLESTLILCTGEFGRTPSVEMGQNGSGAAQGRDHNHWGFSLWMAGGGIKGGTIHGATDDFGFRAVENPVSVHDLHATMLHLLGFDHERLTFRHAGRDFRLTDVFGNVVREVIAAG